MGDIREEVKKHYGQIAERVTEEGKSCCCGSDGCCGDLGSSSPLYSPEELDSLPDDAVKASLGCANPVALANLQKGERVLDLGSGGGIDVFISSKFVGPEGHVYGLDMTDEMLALAEENKKKYGVHNVEFIKGYIEDIPLPDETVDVVTSNCVINLTENKKTALREAWRVLKKGGRLAIADIVEVKPVSEDIRKNISLWVGCIAGALSVEDYKKILAEVGFQHIEITPVHLYTKEVIRQFAEEKKLTDLYESMDAGLMDGAFAGAHIKAWK